MSCKKKLINFVPNDEQRNGLLHDSVWYEMVYAFGVSPHEETDYCAWEHVNFSRVGHAGPCMISSRHHLRATVG